MENQPLVLPSVSNNHGQAYSAATGRFTAPANGTYYFSAGTETAVGPQSVAELSLVVDGGFVHFVNTRGSQQAGSVHAVVDLRAGQQVWLNCYGPSVFWDLPTAFTGFLLFSAEG